MHAIDLVTLPKKQEKARTRRKPAKVPDWHLTGNKTMKYIKEAQARQEEKQKKEEKYDKIKKEAVKNAKQSERKEQKYH